MDNEEFLLLAKLIGIWLKLGMGRIFSGLVSITFRHLAPQEITNLVSQAGLEGIEWGGDVHVPHGDKEKALEVARMTQDAGLRVVSYGSYYRVGSSEGEGLSFHQVLETALALGAPSVRVWAGICGSKQCEVSSRSWVVEECRRIAVLAAQEGLSVLTEYHTGTLTDCADSAVELMKSVGQPTFHSLWQVCSQESALVNKQSLEAIRPWLTHLHVNHWSLNSFQRLPLSEGEDQWLGYLRQAALVEGERYALLEFVQGDQPEAFLRDAAMLKSWLQEINS
ncbi:MAG: TIM barrel protein [Blastochloris sp.]|nr:TIM barrel protein [Blastochloris sp.]